MGPGREQRREVRILNRVEKWTKAGILYKSHQRHSELIVREMSLEGAKARAHGRHTRGAERGERACGGLEGRG